MSAPAWPRTAPGDTGVSVGATWFLLAAGGVAAAFAGAVGWWGIWTALFVIGLVVAALAFASVSVFMYVAVSSARLAAKEDHRDGC